MSIRSVALLALAATLLLTGCPKKRKRGADDIDVSEGQKRAALFEAILANIKKIDPAKAPPVAVDTKLPGFLTGRFSGSGSDENDETLFAYREDLLVPDLANSPEIPFAAPHGGLSGCAFGLKEVRRAKDAEFFTKETLRGCTKLKYLWVVRTTKVAKPKPGATAVANKTATTSFTAGAVDGEVLGYEIATGKLLGGYRFSARNSPTPEGANTGNADDVLEKDLTKNVTAAIQAASRR